MRAAFALAGLLGVALPVSAQDAPRSAATVLITQGAVSGERLTLTVLDCPEDRCQGVVRVNADGASFGMAVHIELADHGATLTLRACDEGALGANCAFYGTGSADRLYVPLGVDGCGERSFIVGRIAPTSADLTAGLAYPVLRWGGAGPRLRIDIEIARRPS